MSSALSSTESAAARRIRLASLRSPIAATPTGTISLALGEPSFDTPPVIVRAMEAALASGATHYCDQQGLLELREAIAAVETRPGADSVAPDEVLVTHGGSGGLAAAILSLINPGDTVAIEDPTFSLYGDLVAMAGGRITYFTRSADGTLDRASMKAAVDDARLVVVCQPSNPTGAVLSRDDWRYLAQATDRARSIVLSDEAYSCLVYEAGEFTSVLDIAELQDRAVLCQTFSKKYAMTGWRIGYLVGPRDVILSAATVQRTLSGSLNTAVQHAAIAALAEAEADAQRMLEIYRHRRDVMRLQLAQLADLHWRVPVGAFYYFCSYLAPESSVELAASLRTAGILVRPGREFGPAGEGHIRLSFATSEQTITAGVRRLASALANLRASH